MALAFSPAPEARNAGTRAKGSAFRIAQPHRRGMAIGAPDAGDLVALTHGLYKGNVRLAELPPTTQESAGDDNAEPP